MNENNITRQEMAEAIKELAHLCYEQHNPALACILIVTALACAEANEDVLLRAVATSATVPAETAAELQRVLGLDRCGNN